MPFKIVVLNKLRVPVKGLIKDEDGNAVKFDFVLLCKRLSQSQMSDVMKDEGQTIGDFIHAVAIGWEGVLEDSGAALDFNTANLAAALDQAGLQSVCYAAYLKEVGAVAKN